MRADQLNRPLEVLLVEDNPGDVKLARRAFDTAHAQAHIHSVMDGEEALRFLYKEGTHAGAPTPDLILLDLNLPQRDGREVLSVVKTDEKLRHIPVIVMTSSESEQDVLHCYQLQANCYVTKPADYERLMETIRLIHAFWFGVVQFPSARRN